MRVGKASAPVPDIPLQEPILITDVGKVLFPFVLCEDYINISGYMLSSMVLMKFLFGIFALWPSMFHNQNEDPSSVWTTAQIVFLVKEEMTCTSEGVSM